MITAQEARKQVLAIIEAEEKDGVEKEIQDIKQKITEAIAKNKLCCNIGHKIQYHKTRLYFTEKLGYEIKRGEGRAYMSDIISW